MLRNVASQRWRVYAWDASTGLPKTGDASNITAKIAIDDGAAASTGTTNPTEVDSTNEKGFYYFPLTQAETNGAKLTLGCKSSTSNIVVIACPPVDYTRAQYSSLDALDSSGRSDVGKINGVSTSPVTAVKAVQGLAVDGVVPTVTTLTNLPAITAGWLTATGIASSAFTAAKFATDAIDSNAIAASGVTEIQSGLATSSALSAVAAQLPTALTSNGNLKVSLQEILTTAITEGATGRIAAAWQGMWNVASPVFTAASVNQTGDSYARIGATGSGLTSLAQSSSYSSTLATNLATLAGHDPGTTLGTSTLTQTQVTGGAYALNSASFAFNSALDFTTTQKAATLARVTLTDTATNLTNLPTMPTDWLTSAGLAASAVSEIQSGLSSQTSVDTVKAEVDTILVATGAAAIRASVGLGAANLDTQLNSIYSGMATATNLASLASAVAALNNLSAAQVLAQVETALATTTRSMPGQTTPSASPSLSAAIMQIFQEQTCPKQQDASEQRIYNRAGGVVNQKRTISDDGTTLTYGALVTGP